MLIIAIRNIAGCGKTRIEKFEKFENRKKEIWANRNSKIITIGPKGAVPKAIQ